MSKVVWNRALIYAPKDEMERLLKKLKIESGRLSYRGKVVGYEAKMTRSSDEKVDLRFYSADDHAGDLFSDIVDDFADVSISAGYVDFQDQEAGAAEFAHDWMKVQNYPHVEDVRDLLDFVLEKRPGETEQDFAMRKNDLLEVLTVKYSLWEYEPKSESSGVPAAVWWLSSIAAIGGVSYWVNRPKA